MSARTVRLPAISSRLTAELGWALILAVGLGLLGGPLAYGQESDSQADRYRLANEYMSSGDYERAAALFEDLYDESPDTHAFYENLREAYVEQRDYDAAIALIEDRMERAGATPERMVDKADLLFLNDDEAAARAAWDEALNLAPDERSTYRTVYESLEEARLYDRAIDVLKQGREALGDSSLFHTQLAEAYTNADRHADALDEYLGFLADQPNRLNFVQRRLEGPMGSDEARRASIDAAEQAVEDNPDNATYHHLLAWLYMEDEAFASAFEAYQTVDRLNEEQGQRLLRFARQAMDASAYDVAAEAYELILDQHPDRPGAPEAQRQLGALYEQQAEEASGTEADATYAAALDAYTTYLETYPEAPEHDVVLANKAAIQLDVRRDLEAATATLERIIDEHPDTDAAVRARFDLGRVALLQDDFERAATRFGTLADDNDLADEALAAEAAYELARLDVYQGAFDEAASRLRRTAVATDTDVANDAIELHVRIQHNRGPDSLDTPLQQYSRAELAHRQGDPDRAIAALDSLANDHPRHSLADEALFLRGTILADTERPDEAVEAFLSVADLHPTSPLADRALFRAARLHETVLDAPDEAIDHYMRLLDDYPRSLHVSEARDQLQALRGPRR